MNIGEYSFQEFYKIAQEFHGYPAPGIFVGAYMVEFGKCLLPPKTIFDVVVETPKCLPDAVQLLTLCSTGNGWLKVVNLSRYALSLYNKYTGHGVRVSLDLQKMEKWPEIRSWFLKLKPKRDQDTALLLSQIEDAGHAYCVHQPVVVSPRFIQGEKSRNIGVCPLCGEAFAKGDGSICRGCQGEAPYLAEGEASWNEKESNLYLRSVPTEEAVGHKILHDMTRIIPGVSKGPAVKAGEVISAGDVCRLHEMGRSVVYVDENEVSEDWVHENDAVLAFAERMAGQGVTYSSTPEEGKINFKAQTDGLLCMDTAKLFDFNMVPDVMCAARQNHIFVEKDKPFAGCRAIPLYISRANLSQALAVLGSEPLFAVHPVRQAKIGVLVTGSEVFQGLIQDKFQPIIKEKVAQFGCDVVASDIVPDDRAVIAESVRSMIDAGSEVIITTAGLSVDPEDVTRHGLLDAGMHDILYGAPILPGAMTLLGRIGSTRVIGVPACALFFKTTSLDLFLPILLADVDLTRRDVARMAEGGFCLNCKSCTFPKCPFGK